MFVSEVSLSPEMHFKHIYFLVWVAVLVLNCREPTQTQCTGYLPQYLVYHARLSLQLNRLL